SIMQRHNPVDLNERSGMWRERGWRGFDHTAEPYSADDLRNERKSYTTSDDLNMSTRRHNQGSMASGASGGSGAQATTGYGVADRYSDYETDYRNHYQTYYSGTGYAYDYYAPAYLYGSTLANDVSY